MWWTVWVKSKGNTWEHRVLFDKGEFYGAENLHSTFLAPDRFTSFLMSLLLTPKGELNNLVNRDGDSVSLSWSKD